MRWKQFRDTQYQVSDTGIIRRMHKKGTTKILKWNLDKDGYPRVDICKDGIIKHFHVHRLVAELYVPNFYGKLIVNHKDAIKLNANFSNLEWCTTQENEDHAIKNGLKYKPTGEKSIHAKLKEIDVLHIRDIGYSKKHELAKKFNVDVATIYDVINRRSWKHI